MQTYSHLCDFHLSMLRYSPSKKLVLVKRKNLFFTKLSFFAHLKAKFLGVMLTVGRQDIRSCQGAEKRGQGPNSTKVKKEIVHFLLRKAL